MTEGHWVLFIISILSFLGFVYYLKKVIYMRKQINKYKNEFDVDDECFTRKRKAKMHLSGTILSSMVRRRYLLLCYGMVTG